MRLIILTAFGIGGATVVGALVGFLFKTIPHKFNDMILGFAAGIMLCASILGLILPSVEMGGNYGIWISVLGVVLGAVFLDFADKLTPHLHKITGVDREKHHGNASINKVMLFVLAIAIHNLPEGMAAGISFGSDNIGDALTVVIGIALQNLPEGMVIISPMLISGISKSRTFAIASLTGVIEVIGTFIGYFLAGISGNILPFLLAFAGGTMLYVISDEMIPETHSHGFEKYATYSFIIGFLIMLIMNFYVG
ncbi:ZIP family metal transporter [Anaerofustis sp.]|uniref:ZIP family metal transporter n=1 Tax=Anaerofustis sp. TaxID=1872517 RepID=UPI0025BC9F47|nr:ZIP family metal transporter [Anaerofustis sp.]